jgi:hypothetical protein
LADDVANANFKTYEQKLRDFLAHIDSCDWASKRVAEFAPNFDFDAWYNGSLKTVGSMVGSGNLAWAQDRTERLGQQFAVFRHFAQQEGAYIDFCHKFMYAEGGFDGLIDEVNEQLFEPFSRDLLKDLFKNSPLETKSIDIPASDRIVHIDHNSPAYREVDTNLANLEEHVRCSNSLAEDNPSDRDRVLAELSASRRLLQAARVRLELIKQLVVPALQWIAKKFADHIIGILATAAFAALATLLGFPIPGL